MAKDYQRLWVAATNATDGTQAAQALAEILADKDGKTFALRLDSKDLELCIEMLGDGIAEHNLKPAEKQAFFVTLRRLAERHGLLPSRMRIVGKVEIADELLASNGFADLRSGTYGEHLVAIKTLRITARDDYVKIRKRFCKEVVLWSTLSHPNILKLVGVQEDTNKRQFSIVSEWMSRGNIMDFIENNHANRLELLYGAAKGLKYLHGVSLAHGGLKGANVLVSNDSPPRACLADFGFMTAIPDPGEPLAHSAHLEGGTMTFMSPELLIPEEFGKKNAVPTPQSDIYAFGLVIFQVLTGEMPFHGTRQSALAYHVFRGTRPTKPENALVIGFSDSLWVFAERCWGGSIESRPKVGEVVTHLKEAAAGWDGLMPPRSLASNTEAMSEAIGGVSKELHPESWVSTRPGSEVPHGSPHTQKNFSHVGQRPDPSPTRKRWNGLGGYVWQGLRHYVWKVLRFFSIWR